VHTGISIPVLICYRNTSSAWRHLDRYVSACLNIGTCATSRAKAESLGRFFSLLGGAKHGKHGSFVSETPARTTRTWTREFIYRQRCWRDETSDGAARNTWPLILSRRKQSRRRTYITATITMAVVYCLWNSVCYMRAVVRYLCIVVCVGWVFGQG